MPQGPIGIRGWLTGAGTPGSTAPRPGAQTQIKERTKDRYYKDPAARAIWLARAQCFTSLGRSETTDTWTAQLRDQTELLEEVGRRLETLPRARKDQVALATWIEGTFKAHKGFLLQPANWWPGWSHKEDFPFWIARPCAAEVNRKRRGNEDCEDFDMLGICA